METIPAIYHAEIQFRPCDSPHKRVSNPYINHLVVCFHDREIICVHLVYLLGDVPPVGRGEKRKPIN